MISASEFLYCLVISDYLPNRKVILIVNDMRFEIIVKRGRGVDVDFRVKAIGLVRLGFEV